MKNFIVIIFYHYRFEFIKPITIQNFYKTLNPEQKAALQEILIDAKETEKNSAAELERIQELSDSEEEDEDGETYGYEEVEEAERENNWDSGYRRAFENLLNED